ncbi:Peptidyl-tRNA hydrolase [bacterium HR37]|nr:Peptidyl-tRNA hydrolase [bacterium HR37]
MNQSGKAVVEATSFFKIPKKDIIVIHDELDLPFGTIRIKPDGGSAGHKGVESIINYLGSKEFIRVRIGIGKPVCKSEVVNYVLSEFRKEEKALLDKVLDKAGDAVLEIINQGIESAMNKFNKRNA